MYLFVTFYFVSFISGGVSSFLTHKIIKLINIKLLLLAATSKNWNGMSLAGASVSSWTVSCTNP